MLRRATPADGDAVAAVFTSSFAGLLAFLPRLHTAEEDRAEFNRIVRRHEVWVAEERGEIVGFAALSERRHEHLYVEPGWQARGVGSALLAHAKERRPDGFDLWTFQRNEGARRFYERHGFRADLVTYRKPLGS